MQDVYCEFVERITSNTSGFSIPNPNRHNNGVVRYYSLKYVNICPAYYSMLATNNSMDDENINPIVTKHIFKFELKFKPNFYKANLFEFTIPNGTFNLPDLTKKLNIECEKGRASSMSFPPLVFDWVDDYIMGLFGRKRSAIEKYLATSHDSIYKMIPSENEEGEEVTSFKLETHFNILPQSARSMSNCNNYLFPDEPETIPYTKVRMIIAPNTKISFSNEHVLKALGFTPKNYGVRGALQRFHIDNKSPDSCMEIIAENSPNANLSVEVEKATKIYFAVSQTMSIFSPVLTTTKFIETRPELLLKDLETFFEKISQKCYMVFKVTYVNKKFTFTLPDDTTLETKIYIPKSILERLAFQNNIVSVSNKTSEIIEQEQLDTAKYMSLSKVLTHDTCQVLIALDGVPSMTNIGHPNQLIAALLPEDGMLKMEKGVGPRVLLPENDQFINFIICRPVEGGKRIPLSWPIDCSVYGMLYGQPINVK